MHFFVKQFSGLAAGALLALFLCSCSTIQNSHRQKEAMMTALDSGDKPAVRQILDDHIADMAGADAIPWQLEAGSFRFLCGDFSGALQSFRTAETLIRGYDERARVSVRDMASETGMLFTNLNALPYRGFRRDRIMLAMLKSLAYLGTHNESAFRAQLRRLRSEEKAAIEAGKEILAKAQTELEEAEKSHPEAVQQAADAQKALQKPELAGSEDFTRSMRQLRSAAGRARGNLLNPAAIFLSALGSARDGLYDNARMDFQRLYEAMPDELLFQQLYLESLRRTRRPLPAALRSVPSLGFPPEKNAVYLLTATGRGPALRQVAVHFPVACAWPVCEFHPDPFPKVTVLAGGRTQNAALLADMDAVFAQEFQALLPGIITRIVLNTLIKEGAFYGGIVTVATVPMSTTARVLASLAITLGGSAYRALFNTADTRSWEILPKTFRLAVLPMPQDRKVEIRFEGSESAAQEVSLPGNCTSAIVVAGGPGPRNLFCHVFPLHD